MCKAIIFFRLVSLLLGNYFAPGLGRVFLKTNAMYLIRNRLTDEIFVFDSIAGVLEKAIEENQNNEDHPSFYLYNISINGFPCELIAELVRDFGSKTLYWKYL